MNFREDTEALSRRTRPLEKYGLYETLKKCELSPKDFNNYLGSLFVSLKNKKKKRIAIQGKTSKTTLRFKSKREFNKVKKPIYKNLFKSERQKKVPLVFKGRRPLSGATCNFRSRKFLTSRTKSNPNVERNGEHIEVMSWRRIGKKLLFI